MEERMIQNIDSEITMLKEDLKQVKGTETEVYTRIVGYFRAVDNWNRGKKEEYKDRKTFLMNPMEVEEKSLFSSNSSNMEKKITEEPAEEKTAKTDSNKVAYYKVFTSNFCRNCPPVKKFLDKVSIKGEELDVSTDLGINATREYEILSTPTVILFDKNDNIVDRAYSVEDIEKIFSKVAVA